MSDSDSGSESDASSSGSGPLVEFNWIGNAQPHDSSAGADQQRQFSGYRADDVHIGVGDVVLLRGEGSEDPYLCWVTRLWESEGQPLLRGRWFYRPSDFPSLASTEFENEIFLSSHVSPKTRRFAVHPHSALVEGL